MNRGYCNEYVILISSYVLSDLNRINRHAQTKSQRARHTEQTENRSERPRRTHNTTWSDQIAQFRFVVPSHPTSRSDRAPENDSPSNTGSCGSSNPPTERCGPISVMQSARPIRSQGIESYVVGHMPVPGSDAMYGDSSWWSARMTNVW